MYDSMHSDLFWLLSEIITISNYTLLKNIFYLIYLSKNQYKIWHVFCTLIKKCMHQLNEKSVNKGCILSLFVSLLTMKYIKWFSCRFVHFHPVTTTTTTIRCARYLWIYFRLFVLLPILQLLHFHMNPPLSAVNIENNEVSYKMIITRSNFSVSPWEFFIFRTRSHHKQIGKTNVTNYVLKWRNNNLFFKN
jgi:hypothetical protein